MPRGLWIMQNGLNHVKVVLRHAHHSHLLLFDFSIVQSSLTLGRHVHSLSAHAWDRGKDTEEITVACSGLKYSLFSTIPSKLKLGCLGDPTLCQLKAYSCQSPLPIVSPEQT